MGKRVKEGVLIMGCENHPLTMLKTNYIEECGTRFKNWLINHSFEDAASIFMNSVMAGSITAIPYAFGTRPVPDDTLYPLTPILPVIFRGGRMERARNVASLVGVYTGIYNAMERIRGKEDIHTNLVAGFGAGVIVSLVSGTNCANAISTGFFTALFYGGRYKVNEKLSEPQLEPILYKKTRHMLSSLGLERYEKNFKKGHLTDKTLPMLNDSDLQEVNLPVGARRLILDHIQRETDTEKGGTRRES